VELYVEDGAYNAAVQAIAELKPCPVVGRITVDQIKIALGEIADLWPSAILPKP